MPSSLFPLAATGGLYFRSCLFLYASSVLIYEYIYIYIYIPPRFCSEFSTPIFRLGVAAVRTFDLTFFLPVRASERLKYFAMFQSVLYYHKERTHCFNVFSWQSVAGLFLFFACFLFVVSLLFWFSLFFLFFYLVVAFSHAPHWV